ncbi:MAG TPA: colanic acid biosynthesis glycosyltransferase WcaL [Gammaproteobacteria bacterium]|nr:colanic acid biosynthesis glycosyltransferase WcaL [Gammaproteobacteria bacterium]
MQSYIINTQAAVDLAHGYDTAIVLKGYPRLSETFIAQEILSLQQRGLKAILVSLRHPTDLAHHAVHEEIILPVLYLPEYLKDEPLRVLRALLSPRHWPQLFRLLRLFRSDLRRDNNRNRWRRFGQALVLNHELPASIRHIHAHFLHTPASVARYCALLRDCSWSVSAHAKDIWTLSDWEKKEKLDACSWAVTCTQVNLQHLHNLASNRQKITLVYHGLDFNRFPPVASTAHKTCEVTLLSVGRAVPKKGYDILLDALAMLPPEFSWRFVHIGDGPLLPQLKQQALQKNLQARLQWLGPQPQHRVLQALQDADIFILPSRITADGDRDGLPNVLMEAQSQGLAVIATDISGIPELVKHPDTGLLVAADDVQALTAAIIQLLQDPELRQRLGHKGQQRVLQHFSMERGVTELAHLFGLADNP